MKRRKLIVGGLVVVLLITLAFFFKVVHDTPKNFPRTSSESTVATSAPVTKKISTASSTATASSQEAPYTNLATPTLFIHGYGGTAGSFSGMLTRLKNEQLGSLQMTLTVSGEGQVAQNGTLDAHNPFIQVLFTDNMNNEWNQAQWLANCLILLKKQGISQVNLVGHSMGGVDVLRYLLTTAQDAQVPEINKIVTIGAPFNEFEVLNAGETLDTVLSSGPQNQSARYSEFAGSLKAISPKLSWLNIAGVLAENNPDAGDGTVPLPSALSLTATAKSLGLNYRNTIVTGSNAAHSQLHENSAVDTAVANFLWGK